MQGIPQGQNSGNQQGNQGGSQKPSLSWQAPPASTPVKGGAQANDKPKSSSAPATPKSPVTNANGEKTNMAAYVGIFVAGLIVGALLGWGIVSGRSDTNTNSNATSTLNGTEGTSTSATNTTGAVMGPSGITVPMSQPAGSSVTVSSVNVTKPTWVVVYDDNNGVVGHALGATLFLPTSAGGATSGTVDLLRPTVSGTSYLVGEVVDDGDYTLSFSKDMAVLDSSGKQAVSVITAN